VVRKAVLLALLTGCGSPPPPLPTPAIVFDEVTDDRVPMLAQTTDLETNKFFGPGASVGDVDGDGRIDLYVSGQKPGLYLNRPDPAGFRFEAAPMPPLDIKPIGTAFGDFDRDGDLDLVVAGQGGARLFINDGTGQFTDGTAKAGIAGPTTDLSDGVAFGDLDGDGWLDLIVANYGVTYDKVLDQQVSHIYMNRRDGTFAELTGVLTSRRSIFAAFADFDGDGVLDLLVPDDATVPYLDTTIHRHDHFFLNRGIDDAGRPVLVESSADLGLDNPRATMTAVIGENGPGWQIFFADVEAAWMYGTTPGTQRYTDLTMASGIYDLQGPNRSELWVNWGSAFIDLDWDGHEDLLVSQAPIAINGPSVLGPVLMHNTGSADLFTMQRYAFGGSLFARAVVLADLDGDGDQDVILAPYFDRFRFYQNDTDLRPHLRIQLVATVGAPGAAGAVVTVTHDGTSQKRMVESGGQPHSHGEPVLEVSLANATVADITVTWPTGARQSLTKVPAGPVTITEPLWLTLSDSRPPADGQTTVTVTVNAAAAGLGKPGTPVNWSSPGGISVDAVCDATGIATLELPPQTIAGPLHGTLTVDGRALPVHPALDYR
jgi:hypothetical protein